MKTQNHIDHCDETKNEFSWLFPHCKPELKETTSRTTVGKVKDLSIIYTYNIYFTIDNASDSHIEVYSTFQMTAIFAKSIICNEKVTCSYTREAVPLGAK